MSDHRPAVSARGVLDGDPDALAGLCDLRGPSVIAYCGVVCGSDQAVDAAAAAFAAFRTSAVGAVDPLALDPDSLLLAKARAAAADRAPDPAGGVPRRDDPLCPEVPRLLAGAAAHALVPSERHHLRRHLARCVACRAAQNTQREAERVYLHPPIGTLDPIARQAIIAALRHAAPVAGEAVVSTNASAPVPGSERPAFLAGTPTPPPGRPVVVAGSPTDAAPGRQPSADRPHRVTGPPIAAGPAPPAAAGHRDPVAPAPAAPPAPSGPTDRRDSVDGSPDPAAPAPGGPVPQRIRTPIPAGPAATAPDGPEPPPARRSVAGRVRGVRSIPRPSLRGASAAPENPPAGHSTHTGEAATGVIPVDQIAAALGYADPPADLPARDPTRGATLGRLVGRLPGVRILAPAGVVLVAVLVALAIAGVFSPAHPTSPAPGSGVPTGSGNTGGAIVPDPAAVRRARVAAGTVRLLPAPAASVPPNNGAPSATGGGYRAG